MIIIDGQIAFKFSIGTFKDFLTANDLINFKAAEETGGALPTFEMTFKTDNELIIQQLNEGNTLQISYGKDKENLIDVELFIAKQIGINEQGYSKRIIKIVGLLDRFEYINNPVMQITEKKSGIEVLKDTASKYFRFDSNITISSDSQNWIQNNISDRAFIKELSMRSYLSDSFISTGITLSGKFIVRDIKKKLKDNFDWKFTHSPQKDNDINYDSDFLPISETGFINNWLGYGRRKLINDLDSGVSSEVLETFKPLMALTSTLSRKATMEAKLAESGVLNENVHSNYHRAFLKNLSNLAIFSSARITLTFQNEFKDINLLDLVMFKTTESGTDSDGRNSSEIYAGLYLISKITRNIQNNSMMTTVELCRESFNANTGNLV